MKHIALIPGILFLMFTLNSCCTGCFKGNMITAACCEKEYYEDQVTEWVEEEVFVEGAKGGSTIVRRPIVTTVKKQVKCSACGSFYCASAACCDTVSKDVLKRRTAQGGTGEPHIGQIPTMKVLAP